MPLFQKTVLKKYIRSIDPAKLETQWKLFAAHFHNPAVQQNIRNSKEEQYQEGFVDDLFVKILGYTKNPTPDYNFITEQKNEGNSKKADGAIIIDKKIRAVVELKGCNTTDLGKVEAQAFGYKSRQTGCDYVVVSNFEKLRFYVENAVEHIEFHLFELSKEDFELLWLYLSHDSISTDLPLKLKKESLSTEDTITKKLYQDYSVFRRELFNDLVLKNPETNKLLLFKKTQKLLDRFLFIFFAEDRLLLPVNLIKNIIAEWKQLQEMRVEHSLYERFKLYFNDLNTGNPKQDIFAYNGGLFQPDELLDNLQVDDQLLFEHTHKLSTYDFESEIDVNILGHIFENSLNEIEEIENKISEENPSPLGSLPAGKTGPGETSKRKKDGVFYTPKYITKYIVENTLGKLCKAKKAELEITDEVYATAKKRSKKRLENLQRYRDWLLQLSICDPACGSGTFLNQALEFLIEEHRYVDELSAKYNDDPLVLSDAENSILENNLYGVDINEESVHIAKLSLWLRTAQRNRKLNDLNQNLKCGNSLIDDPEVAGKKAFDWGKEFPQVFKEKDKKAFHITTAVHDSRTSERMVKYKVRQKRFMGTKPFPEPIPFSEKEELLVFQIVGEIVEEDDLNLMAFNVCRDHMHLLLVCEETEVPKIVQKIKAKTARAVNIGRAASASMQHAALSSPAAPGPMPPVWTQKYSCKPVTSLEQLQNTEKYIRTNRTKHELPPLPLPRQQGSMLPCRPFLRPSYEEAFRPEYTGGFDVVIGNPPYVQSHSMDEATKNYFYSEYSCAEYQINFYAIFIEKITRILNDQSIYSIIIPNYWMSTKYDSRLRELIFLKNHCIEILNVFRVFGDATVDTVILTGKKTEEEKYPKTTQVISLNPKLPKIADRLAAIGNKEWDLKKQVQFKTNTDDTLISFDKNFELNGNKTLGDFFHFKKGMQPYEKGKGIPAQTREMMNDRIYNAPTKLDSSYEVLLKARNVQRYFKNGTSGYIKYGINLAAPRNPEIFTGPRILINRILSKKAIDGFYIEEDCINNSDIFNLMPKSENINSKVLAAFILSPLCAIYFKKKNVNLNRAAFPKINVNTLEKFPIPQLSEDSEKALEKSVDLITQQIKDLENLISKFTTYFSGQYNLQKLPRKLENWHELDFSGFVKELNKAIKKIGGEPLTKKDEFEWMDLFEENKQKAQALQSEISQTDKEIDAMVYGLYGLTKEEIAVVENS